MLRTTILATFALALGGLSAVPAQGSTDPDRPLTSAAGQRVSTGTVDRLAENLDRTVGEVTELLDTDAAARVHDGQLYYRDNFEAGDSATPEPAPRASAPLARTFRLHSQPGARRTIYLDFNGERVCDSLWHEARNLPGRCIDAPAFDTNGSAGFSRAERRAIQSAWQRVAEDYAPFRVDITTERPKASDLTRTSSSDRRYGVHAVVTSSSRVRNQVCGGRGCGGVAFVDVFNKRGAANRGRVFWVFPREVRNKSRRIADIASHEAGHTLGLSHDGNRSSAYDTGHGIWAPLMGSSNRRLTQWSRGEYSGANNRENDLKVISTHGAPRVRDDHADGKRRATRLRAGRARSGVISRGSDVDTFRLRMNCRARLKVKVRNAGSSPNLDVSLTVM